QLTNDTGLDSEVLALTAKAGKSIAQSVAQLQLSTTNALNQKVNKTDISNAVNSTSQTTVASSQAVKTAYDLANSKYTAQDASPTQKGLVQLANNLTTDDATKALTAAQGVAIKRRLDKFIINNNCQDDADTLVVDGIYSYGSGDMSNKNLPTSHNYYVQVISGDSPGWHRQVAMRAYSGDRYERYKLSFNGNWSPWKRADIGGLFGRFDSPNINLNDFKSDGVFSIGHATSRPVAHSGMLFVLSGGVEGRTGTLQRYTLHNKQECYERWFDASTNSWSNWARVDGAEWSTLRNKPTTVDGFGITDAVKKTGDTMTGILNINHAASYLRGKNNGVDDWFVGRVRDNDNDVALVSYQYSTGVHLKADRVESNKPIYHGANKVFDEGNLLPVKQINLRSHIPNTQIEYQNATPAELPMGSYIGFTTNAQLSGNGVFSGWGFVSKTDNTQAFRQAVNFDRHFAQWGNNASGWGSVHEYFMLRPRLEVSNLNDVTMCGVYSQVANANAQPNLNYPAQEAGTLLVTPSAYGYQQEYTTFFSNKKFVRGREGNRWLPWKQIDGADWSEVRNKPTTASGLGINDFDNRVTALFTYQKIGNFEIRKYPDGTMIQTYFYDVNDLKEWNEKTFTWAVAFADKPMVIPKVEHTYGINSDVGSAIMRKSTNAVCYYKLYEHNSENQGDCRVQFLGVGRWK
ncbi:tail fiber protein, partial [Glaesserella parasuis]|nr:tail fiber protein [Glaesserella parasuis]